MAYEKNGDVFYRTAKFDGYGKLSHYPIEQLESGARIEINDSKEDPLDFVIWKAASRRAVVGLTLGQGQTRLAYRMLGNGQ